MYHFSGKFHQTYHTFAACLMPPQMGSHLDLMLPVLFWPNYNISPTAGFPEIMELLFLSYHLG